MSEKPISLLRQRMLEDMTVRNFGEKTRNDYIRHVKTCVPFGSGNNVKTTFARAVPWARVSLPIASAITRTFVSSTSL